jgi:hypothetical protein
MSPANQTIRKTTRAGPSSLFPKQRNKSEGVGDIDEAEETLCSVRENLYCGEQKAVSKEAKVRALRTGSWASAGSRRVTTKAKSAERHPDGDA